MENLFRSNGYPIHVFQNCVKKFLDKKFINSSKDAVSNDAVIVCIPYIGKPSLIFKKKIMSILSEHLNRDIRCVFKSHTVGMHFSLKCATPHSLLSNVIYKFICLCDAKLSYIGKTKRHLITRVGEHGSKQSAIFTHLENCYQCRSGYNIDCFTVMDRGNCDFDCYVKEALLIKKLNPSLNSHMYSGSTYQLKLF